MKINVVECQHESVLKAIELSLIIDDNMPDIEKVFVEPTQALFQNYNEDDICDHLPAVVINIAEETVGEESQADQTQVSIDENGKVVGNGCCGETFTVNQFYTVDIVVEQCENVYALAGKLSCSLEQIMCRLPQFKYNGNFNQTLDESLSDNFYIKTYSFYVEYEKTTGR